MFLTVQTHTATKNLSQRIDGHTSCRTECAAVWIFINKTYFAVTLLVEVDLLRRMWFIWSYLDFWGMWPQI